MVVLLICPNQRLINLVLLNLNFCPCALHAARSRWLLLISYCIALVSPRNWVPFMEEGLFRQSSNMV